MDVANANINDQTISTISNNTLAYTKKTLGEKVTYIAARQLVDWFNEFLWVIRHPNGIPDLVKLCQEHPHVFDGKLESIANLVSNKTKSEQVQMAIDAHIMKDKIEKQEEATKQLDKTITKKVMDKIRNVYTENVSADEKFNIINWINDILLEEQNSSKEAMVQRLKNAIENGLNEILYGSKE